VYPNDPGRRFQITWEDQTHSHPRDLHVGGERSEWRVYPGVTLGTSLSTLDSLNGGPLSVSGFEWDYPGGVGSYNGGRLDTLWRRGNALGGLIRLALAPDSGAPDSLLRQVLGDHQFSSQLPALHALNPRVRSIVVRPR